MFIADNSKVTLIEVNVYIFEILRHVLETDIFFISL